MAANISNIAQGTNIKNFKSLEQSENAENG